MAKNWSEVNRAWCPPITISKLNPSDCEDMAEITLLAFMDDPNSSCFHPERIGHSAEELLVIHKPSVALRWRNRILNEGVYLKATIPVTDAHGKPNTLVGISVWDNPSRTRLYKLSLWEWLLKNVIYPVQRFIFTKKEALGLPPEVHGLIKAQYDATFGPAGVAEGQKPWYLHILAVHPKWQGIGAGKALLEWGMERAREDNSPVYLESSPVAYKFYLGQGYQETIALTCFANGVSAQIPGMIWYPTMKIKT
ncbi:hypothetical protein M422DRAFT_240368 [Sphaerobolus stellatus SS14]|nr:hypothetical protein M422DRAFT_240368 [Sphaerobolus stellatus SS14]